MIGRCTVKTIDASRRVLLFCAWSVSYSCCVPRFLCEFGTSLGQLFDETLMSVLLVASSLDIGSTAEHQHSCHHSQQFTFHFFLLTHRNLRAKLVKIAEKERSPPLFNLFLAISVPQAPPSLPFREGCAEHKEIMALSCSAVSFFIYTKLFVKRKQTWIITIQTPPPTPPLEGRGER